MSNTHIAALLATLRAELEGLSGPERARLEAAIGELEAELASGKDPELSLADRARRRIEQFEIEHPTATGITNRVMQALADLGI